MWFTDHPAEGVPPKRVVYVGPSHELEGGPAVVVTDKGAIRKVGRVSTGMSVRTDGKASPSLVTLPEVVMERLRKADGHINSAERKLDFRKVERGIWSAVQAKARFAEAWLWLNEAGVELPPLERYLARNVVRERLEAFQRAPKSDLMVTAWEEAEAAEQAVREVELPALTGYRPIVDRTLLEESISRKHRFIDALHGIRHVVEDVVAKRFLNLRRGDWVRLENGDIGRVQRLEGLTVRVFVPAPYPRLRHWYGLLLERVEPPTVEAPEEGWVESAWRLARKSLFRPDDYPAPAGAPYSTDVCSAVEVRMGRDEGRMECWYVSFGNRTVDIPFSEDGQHQLPALLEWLQTVSRGDLPIAIELDDEGLVTTMIAHASGPARLFVRVIEPWDEETDAVAAVVDRDSFLDAFRSELERLLRRRFPDPRDCMNESIIDFEDMQEHPFMIRK